MKLLPPPSSKRKRDQAKKPRNWKTGDVVQIVEVPPIGPLHTDLSHLLGLFGVVTEAHQENDTPPMNWITAPKDWSGWAANGPRRSWGCPYAERVVPRYKCDIKLAPFIKIQFVTTLDEESESENKQQHQQQAAR